jgi:hypothetical protein
MKRLSVYALLLILIGVVFIGVASHYREGFGYNMGTIIQLQSSHVPNSPEEMEKEQAAYLRQVQRDLIGLTGSGL